MRTANIGPLGPDLLHAVYEPDVSCGIHTVMSGSYEVIIEPIKLKQV